MSLFSARPHDNVITIPGRSSTPGSAGASRDAPDESERLAAARNVLAALIAGDEPDRRAFELVERHLQRYVRRVFLDADADDVIQAAMTRLIDRREKLAEATIENPWAYLVRTTRNAAVDTLRARSRRREVNLDDVSDAVPVEDSVAAFIDSHATHAAVVRALRTHVEAGDSQTVQIVTTWLDMADERGKPPSTRDAAKRARVSHTTVAHALQRFRDTIAEGRRGG